MNKLDCAAAKKSFLEYSPPPLSPLCPPTLTKKIWPLVFELFLEHIGTKLVLLRLLCLPQTLDENEVFHFHARYHLNDFVVSKQPPPPFKNIQIFGHPPRYFIVFFGLASLILFSAPLPFLMIEEKILKAVLLNLRPTGIDSMFGK